jgi:PAS domain S-box-containing protein
MHKAKHNRRAGDSTSSTSIRRKLLIIIMAVSSITLIASSLLIILFQIESFKTHLIDVLSSETKMIAGNCVAAVQFDDSHDALVVLESLRARPEIAYAEITRADNSILTTYRRKGFHGTPQADPKLRKWSIGHDWLVAQEPIIVDGHTIGDVFIQSDLSEIFTFRKQIITVVALVFIVVFLAALLLSSKLQQLISGPIEHLTNTAKNISDTRDYSLRATHSSHDEVGLLTKAFNEMLSEIEFRTSELQQKDFVIHSSSTAIATATLEGRLTYINPAFLSAWGYDNINEVTGRLFHEFWMVEDRKDEILADLTGDKRVWNDEVKAKRKDGSFFDIRGSAATVLNAQGEPIALMSTAIDITERNRIEKERDLLLHDTDKRVQELRCMYGVSESIRTRTTLTEILKDVVELIPSGWHYPEITRAKIKFDNEEYISQPFEETEWEQRAQITANGAMRGLISVFYTEQCPELDEGPFLKEERNLINGIARALNETIERKNTETERDRLTWAIEQADEAVVITDTEATIQYVSPAFEHITGYTREEVIGKKPRFLHSGKQTKAFYNEMWNSLLRGETWCGRFTNKKKDESLYTEEATISPVHNSAGETINYIAVKRDITHEIELETQLRQAQKMEAVGQLAGGIAHDFNNLLQVILGYGDMAIAELNDDDPASASIEEIRKAGLRAKTLVSQMLAFSRRQVLEMKDLDLNEVIADLMKMIHRVIGEHITLNAIAGDHLGIVRADQGQIEQILMNLCVNARDAMPEAGTITIKTDNVLNDKEFCKANSWETPGPYVLLSVTDTGCGMDEKTVDKIFEPFFTSKGVGKGTGLGLSTVYGLVQQHKGEIQVFSEVGKGTQFKIYLPIIQKPVETVEIVENRHAPTGSETILLAEDDRPIRELTQLFLEKAGYTVLPAIDGEEALEVFDNHADQIDMALLDVMMPKLGGKAVYEHIHKEKPNTRVLFTSGYSMDAIHTNFVLDEGLALIQKPYQQDSLRQRIRAILDEK